MRDNYPQRSSGGFFNTLGYLAAVVLVVGILSKSGFRFNLPGKMTRESTEELTVNSASLGGTADFTPLNDPDKLVLPPAGDHVASYSEIESERSDKQASARTVGARVSTGDWIANFSTPAIREALLNGIPAGISMAVGIAKVKDGYTIASMDDFREMVINPLLKVKNKSGDPQYFKYAANSKKWAQGLGKKPGYSERSLLSILEKYNLEDLDDEVKAHLADKDFDPETLRKADRVSLEVGTRLREKSHTAREVETTTVEDGPARWKNDYDQMVGEEVAREIAKKKLQTKSYITEEDMNQLIEETNVETEKVIKNKLAFPGRKINPDHKDAAEKLDVTKPENSQAREEVYQKKLSKRKKERT